MRQPDKNRYIGSVTRENTRDIPFQENLIDIVHVNRVLERNYPLSTRCYEIVPEDQVELSRRVGNDMIMTTQLWELGRRNEIDQFGRKHYVDGTMKTPESLSEITEPDVGILEKRIDSILDLARNRGPGTIVSVEHAPRLVTVAMGYQDYMVAMLDNPAFVEEFQARVTDFCERQLEMVLSKPVDVVQTALDVCSNTGPMYSRAMIEEFEYPFLRRTVSRIKDAGKLALLHIDGRIGSLIPDFIEMGVDILNPVEPSENQSIVELKKRFGARIAFQGNLDVTSVLAVMTPEQVRQRAEELVREMSEGGGFVLASSHDIPAEVPWENFEAMRNAAVNS